MIRNSLSLLDLAASLIPRFLSTSDVFTSMLPTGGSLCALPSRVGKGALLGLVVCLLATGASPVWAQTTSLTSLNFAITGNTRPPTEDDSAAYPIAIITKIFQDMQAASPRPAFAVATGNYMFSNPDVDGTQSTQLGYYLTASSNFTNTLYPAMGNHECDGSIEDNCSTVLSGNTYN